ncbi:ABC transporter substrate-binding protein [Caulobacter vibrioides]|uniref:Iron compound ABC transporter, periplasmic substrate-binding protein n=2 Tax=Caulobacter vibrioides TaxID=155892 RepID=Q9A904_CAUVC|nr:ABC transporter substrate-binding protein [Caulobacter vibrioides]YP_002516622.1 ABC-transporter substrate binding protein [Caulobacter vibrioides NA1000]AAK23174.1 iron compound ABC transporter, periplasmic substrate-binding protein [Caulobacter vibrioides CB15]ACL94714.1 ABC-transporter substrate binding protein [Caulobacter vibrioides NA1000]ATC28016.1 ABC transporter substrate-binding protein [Caulobacter vibrioides]QXZ53273.1 ABC transporter substrate-binding protein [Caulobacter vibri
MNAAKAFCALAAAMVLVPAGAWAAPRVMSLDSCADQYVLALAPREAIVGLSHRAVAPDSYLRDKAAGLPLRRATFESLVSARPALVVRQWGGDARLTKALQAKGVATVTLDDATDFDGVRANVRKVAVALDRRPQGEALIAGMDARLKAAAGAGRGRETLYLTPSGYTAGANTLIDAMLRAAGYANATKAAYFAPVSLEQMVMTPPAAVVLGMFDRARAGADRWGPGRHAALRRAVETRAVAELPAAMVGCSAWFAADAALVLARAAR